MRYEQISSGAQKEKWKDIAEYEGDYQISTLGRVRSCKYGDYRIRKPFIAGKGYVAIDLCKAAKAKKFYLHRLVAQHFIKNPNNLPEVNHNDGNKLNNAKNNLNWTDGIGNMKHARESLGFNQDGENSHRAKLTEKDVFNIISLYKTGRYSHAEIAKKYKVGASNIGAILNRTNWKHLKIA